MLESTMAAALGVFVIGFLCWHHFALRGGSNGGYRKAPKASHGRTAAPADQGAGAHSSGSGGSGAGHASASQTNAAGHAGQNLSQNLIGAQNVGPLSMQGMQALQAQGMAGLRQQGLQQQQLQQAFRAARAESLKIERAGIKLGEIEAWRVWRLCGWFVRSAYREDIWAPGEAMTGKLDGGHGVHAWNTLSAALTYGVGIGGAATIVVGRVHLWGEVVEHERGYRAEFAQIIAFDTIIPPSPKAAKTIEPLATLRERYKLTAPV